MELRRHREVQLVTSGVVVECIRPRIASWAVWRSLPWKSVTDFHVDFFIIDSCIKSQGNCTDTDTYANDTEGTSIPAT
jgi:hypothetical protein